MYTLFTKDNCTQCVFMKRELEKHNIPFEEKNIMNQEHLQHAMRFGVTGLPILVKDDELKAFGFRPDVVKTLKKSTV